MLRWFTQRLLRFVLSITFPSSTDLVYFESFITRVLGKHWVTYFHVGVRYPSCEHWYPAKHGSEGKLVLSGWPTEVTSTGSRRAGLAPAQWSRVKSFPTRSRILTSSVFVSFKTRVRCFSLFMMWSSDFIYNYMNIRTAFGNWGQDGSWLLSTT